MITTTLTTKTTIQTTNCRLWMAVSHPSKKLS